MTLRRLGGALLLLGVLPALLILWSRRLSHIMELPGLDPHPTAWIVTACGTVMTIWAAWRLRVDGRARPLSGQPATRWVTRGPWALLRNPIALGLAMVWGGTAVALGSPGATWVVSPVLLLGMGAWIIGFQRPDQLRRLGPEPVPPLATMPRPGPGAPDWRDRLGAFFTVLTVWALLYEVVGHLPVPGAINVVNDFEWRWPVLTWTTPLYTSAYLATCFMLFGPRTRSFLSEWCLDARLGMVLGFLVILVVPFVAPYRPFQDDGPFGWELAQERLGGVGERASFPSFHCFWALMAARLADERGPLFRVLLWTWACLVCIATVTTGMHAIVDVVSAVGLVWISASRRRMWSWLVVRAEEMARAWREVRFGPVTIVNHAAAAGAAAAVGVLTASWLAGPASITLVASVTAGTLAGGAVAAGLAGPRMRPGWFAGRSLSSAGALAGAALASLLAWPWAAEPWTALAACACAAPAVVAMGRLRCLVRGCCHGREASGHGAIRHLHPRSLADAGSSHPPARTPVALASMLGMTLLACVLGRLWGTGCEASLLIGAALMLGAMGRFAEEAWRAPGPASSRLRLSGGQWICVAVVVAGALCTCVTTERLPEPRGLGAGALLLAAAAALATSTLLGVRVALYTRGHERFVPAVHAAQRVDRPG